MKLFVPASLSAFPSISSKWQSSSCKLSWAKLFVSAPPFAKLCALSFSVSSKLSLWKLKLCKVKLCAISLCKLQLGKIKLCKLSSDKLKLFSVKLSKLLLCKLKLGKVKLGLSKQDWLKPKAFVVRLSQGKLAKLICHCGGFSCNHPNQAKARP